MCRASTRPWFNPSTVKQQQTNKSSAKDKYRGMHRHYPQSKVCLMPLVKWTSVGCSLALLMQMAKCREGYNTAGYLMWWSSCRQPLLLLNEIIRFQVVLPNTTEWWDTHLFNWLSAELSAEIENYRLPCSEAEILHNSHHSRSENKIDLTQILPPLLKKKITIKKILCF